MNASGSGRLTSYVTKKGRFFFFGYPLNARLVRNEREQKETGNGNGRAKGRDREGYDSHCFI